MLLSYYVTEKLFSLFCPFIQEILIPEWGYGSSGRALAYQILGPELKFSPQKRKKERKELFT
jgi:hypothetical protein